MPARSVGAACNGEPASNTWQRLATALGSRRGALRACATTTRMPAPKRSPGLLRQDAPAGAAMRFPSGFSRQGFMPSPCLPRSKIHRPAGFRHTGPIGMSAASIAPASIAPASIAPASIASRFDCNLPGLFFMPAYCADSGLDADDLWASIQAAEFIPRSDRSALYRGHELPRSKIYVADTPEGSWPVYKFPGFQYRAVLEHYKRLHAVPWLQPVFAAVRATAVSGVPIECNQAIVTRYESGTDCIGWHSDKMTSIADPSIVFDLSLGGERTLCIRESEDGPVTRIPMPHGSAVAFDTTFNKRYQHAVLAEPGAPPRASIVFRNIATLMTDAAVRAKVRDCDV